MYGDLDCFRESISTFWHSEQILLCAIEMGGKIDSETAYQNIKKNLKELKKIRKKHKEENCDDC
jgi:hypothetical protein